MKQINFPKLSKEKLLERLEHPNGIARVIIDTDAANEIDDQFALTWALLSPEKLKIEAVTAEPFSFAHHQRELFDAEKILDQDKANKQSSFVFETSDILFSELTNIVSDPKIRKQSACLLLFH